MIQLFWSDFSRMLAKITFLVFTRSSRNLQTKFTYRIKSLWSFIQERRTTSKPPKVKRSFYSSKEKSYLGNLLPCWTTCISGIFQPKIWQEIQAFLIHGVRVHQTHSSCWSYTLVPFLSLPLIKKKYIYPFILFCRENFRTRRFCNFYPHVANFWSCFLLISKEFKWFW